MCIGDSGPQSPNGWSTRLRRDPLHVSKHRHGWGKLHLLHASLQNGTHELHLLLLHLLHLLLLHLSVGICLLHRHPARGRNLNDPLCQAAT